MSLKGVYIPMWAGADVAVQVPLGNPATASGWASWSKSVAVATVTTGSMNRYATGRGRVANPAADVLRLRVDWTS